MPTTTVVSAAAKEEGMEMDDNYLMEDIVIEILQYLPLKSLARANCVSQQWRSYVSTCLLRSCRSSPWGSPLIQGFFFQESNITKNGVPIHFLSSSKQPPTSENPLQRLLKVPIQIVAYSNGLLLCGRSNRDPLIHYYVCNPTTNMVISLPKPINIFSSVKVGFHAEKNSGCDSVCFTIVRFGLLGVPFIEIFTSETNVWVPVDLSFEVPQSLFLPFEGPAAAFLDGVFYWLEFRSLIYAFDLLNNKFLQLDLPPESGEYRGNVFARRLDAANGALHMVSTDGDRIEIWVRKSEKERSSWALKGRLSVKTLVDNNTNIFSATAAEEAGQRFLGIVGFQPSDSEKIFLNTSEIVVSYDLRSGKVQQIHSFNAPCSYVSELMFFPYESYERPRLI